MKHTKDIEVYNLKDRLIELGDDEFANFEEGQSKNVEELYCTFKDRIVEHHGESIYRCSQCGEDIEEGSFCSKECAKHFFSEIT